MHRLLDPSPALAVREEGALAPALQLCGAGRAFGATRALRPLQLALAPGERVALVGPSGAGKSTLVGLCNTSLSPSEGEVEVLGQRPARLGQPALRRLRARIGTIYQDLRLVEQASVLQNVIAGGLGRASLVGSLASLFSRSAAARVAGLLEAVGIADKLLERVDRLSGGEAQRVAIARVLYQDPELIIADEPLSSLDPARAEELVALFARAFAGKTLLLSTHQLEPVLPLVDRVLGLRAGELVFDRPARDLVPQDLARLYRLASAGAP